MKKTRQIFSRFFLNDRTYSLSDVAQFMAAFYFDMRTIHFLTVGKEFYTLHSLAEELYEKAEEYYDDLVETYLGYNESYTPMYAIPQEWNELRGQTAEGGAEDFDVERVTSIVTTELQNIFDICENIDKSKYSSFVYSKIDSILEYLDKEIYKITQFGK